MILGIIAGLGTTKLAALSFAIIIVYAIINHRTLRVRIPWQLWAIVAILELSELWSLVPGKATYESCAILSAYLSWRILPRKHFIYGISLVATVQIGVILWQYHQGIVRPWGISRNASVIGLAGMWGMPAVIMSLQGGISLSRTAMLGSIILATKSRIYVLSAILLIVLSLLVGLHVTPNRYLSSNTIHKEAQLRIDAIDGNDTRSMDIPLQPVQWRWSGYGFGQFYFQTGHIQPHNIIVRTWYEMGAFSIVIFGLLLTLWWQWGHDWRFLACALVTGMLTDELLGSVEGVYMILTYAIMSETFPATFQVERIKQWRLLQSLRRLTSLRNTASVRKLTSTRRKPPANGLPV